MVPNGSKHFMRYRLRMSMRVLIQTLSARTPLCQSPSVHAIYEIPNVECLLGFVGIHTAVNTGAVGRLFVIGFCIANMMANKATADPKQASGSAMYSSEPHEVTDVLLCKINICRSIYRTRILVPGASWFSEPQRDDPITGIGEPTWCAKARQWLRRRLVS